MIDNLLVLGNGREIYSGPTQKMVDYFDSIQQPIPLHENPSEYVLNLINLDFIGDT